jgi:Cu/Ag efflux pump CusA
MFNTRRYDYCTTKKQPVFKRDQQQYDCFAKRNFETFERICNRKCCKGSAEVNREDLQTLGIVTARLDNGNLGGTIQEIQKQINQKIKLPSGYSVVYGGAYAEQQQSLKNY